MSVSKKMFIPAKGTELRLTEDWEINFRQKGKVDAFEEADLIDEIGENNHRYTIPRSSWIKFSNLSLYSSNDKTDHVIFEVIESPVEEIEGEKCQVLLRQFNTLEYDETRGDLPSDTENFEYFTSKDRWVDERVTGVFKTFEEAEDKLAQEKSSDRIWEVNGDAPDKNAHIFEDPENCQHDLKVDLRDTEFGCGPRVKFKRQKPRYSFHFRCNLPQSLIYLEKEADSIYSLKDLCRNVYPFVVFKMGNRNWVLRSSLPYRNIFDLDDNTFQRRKDGIKKAKKLIKNNWREYEDKISDIKGNRRRYS